MDPEVPVDSAQGIRARRKSIAVGLWIAQLVLAIMFSAAGFMKLTMPIPQLADAMVWPGDVAPVLVRFIGLAELLGGIGLIVPALTRIAPVLTPLAAIGIVTIMLLAVAFHVTRGELPPVGVNVLLGSLATFVAWGRLKKVPIAPRSRGV